MSKLSLDNIMSVTILSALQGLNDDNTSVLALFTTDQPIIQNYGTSRNYREPVSVANDFGSSSDAFALASVVFSQNPNILTGGGYLTIIPRLAAAAAAPAVILGTSMIDISSFTEDDYKIELTIDGGSVTVYDIDEVDTSSVGAFQASLNTAALTSAGVAFVVSGNLGSARVTLKTIAAGATKSILVGSDSTGTDIAPLLFLSGSATGSATGAETLKDAILRTYNSVPYFGIILDEFPTDAIIVEVGTIIQSINKILFLGTEASADVAGVYTDVKDAGLTQVRCLFYSVSLAKALEFAAGYASRGLSVNYDAPDTVSTMHLKEIKGLVADELTQTFLDSCVTAGVDVYANFGVPKVFTSGANEFFDQVYTSLALKLRLQIAGFNYLAQTNTKIPQTESGMNGLKSVLRKILALFVTNGAFAPGTWNSPTTFGNPGDMIRNISDFGFYIYSSPISEQNQVQRSARVAPLIQVAGKSSGAIHSSDVIVNIED